MKEISDYWGGWFAGFSDGEGYFCIYKDNSRSSCAAYQCRFEIGLRNDDNQVLEMICDTLGIGNIYKIPVYPHDLPNARPGTRFQIGGIKDCVELVKFFEKYPLQAKKQNDFAIWKLAVAELQKPFACRDADLLEYLYLKIKEVRQYEVADELPRPKKIELQLTIEF